mmetsp:Transcript_14049/g.39734  ORF Transcript_14049/g.39734 Transcript_14049/m.39734 type:complete len:513 (-) Transcript_14049:105-1643(-)
MGDDFLLLFVAGVQEGRRGSVDVEAVPEEHQGLLDPQYERASSREWAESMLRWDGSATAAAAIESDGGNVIANYDDLQASGSTQSNRGLQMEHVVRLKAKSMRLRKRQREKEERRKREAAEGKERGLCGVPWDEVFNPISDFLHVKEAILSNWINLMLLALPFAITSHYLAWPAVIVFVFNLISVVPLALLLGEITEDLAIRFGDVWGGLINATFGNVVEMILSIVLLMKGLTTVVSTSLIGSILSNLLLVIGCCFFVGGLNFKHQHFSSGASKANVSLLFMSCIAMLLPSMVGYSNGKDDNEKVVNISRIIALVMTAMYVCYLYFQLVTHNHIFISDNDNRVTNEENGEADEVEEELEKPSYSLLGALMMMTMTTVVVAFCSEYLSGSIEEVSKKSGLSLSFIGMIILPIAGNACEHITAVLVAAKNKMDLAIAVGVGSSIQIAIFVYPFVVLVGWASNVDFTMKLNQFDVLVVCVSVILAAFVTMDGQSHWFTGLMLIATYVLIAVAYFF